MSLESTPRVGWIGLGNMGLAMASHVQRALMDAGRPGVAFTNRTLSRGDGLRLLGGTAYSTVREVLQASDVIFTSVANDAVIRSIVEDALQQPANLHGKVICDFSTIAPDNAHELSERLEAVGAALVTAPVFGSTSVAEAAGLVVIISGSNVAVEKVLPFCTGVIGRAVIRLGEDVRSSCSLKVVGNTILVSLAEIVSAAHVLAEKSGVGNEPVEQLLNLMFNGGPMLNYSQRVTKGGYAPSPVARPSFGIDLAIKDAGLALELGRQVGASLEVVEIAKRHLEEARSTQGGHLDSTAIYGVLRQRAGLDFDSDVVKQAGRP